jgi:ABC-type nitrate/sulfonate/bicarbonate transport system substrate-binding protein
MDKQTIRIGGVPEHFNLPWHLAMEKGQFKARGIDVVWTTFKGGTGQMTKALRQDEIDLCVLLTEGIITDIIQDNPSKIISQYINTPLTWGVHTGTSNPLQQYSDIFDRRFAISRFGSGSHLMPIVDANSKGLQLQSDQFVSIRNLEGALQSLAKLESDVFYWEKYTTKPYVDSGQLRRLGEYLTPWPCFVIAASNNILERQAAHVISVLKAIHESCNDFMKNANAITMVSQRYHQQMADVARWYHSTEWATHGWVSDKMVQSVIYHLKLAGIVEEDKEIPELIWNR